MGLDKRTMTIWELEFLKCQTSKALKDYIKKYADEPRNPFVEEAKAKLNEPIFTIKKNTSSNSNNWLKDNVDLLVKALFIVIGLGCAYFIGEGVSSWRNKRNAEYNRAQMEAILRQTEQRDKMIQAINVRFQQQLEKINNNHDSDISASENCLNNNTYTHQIADYNYTLFTPYDLDYTDVMNEYNNDVASRITPQEFLNERLGSECKSCHGTKKCPVCNGTKTTSSFGNTYKCRVCNDIGDCPTCGGTGLASWNR